MLVRGTIDHPWKTGAPARVFDSWEKATAHLRDHVLAEPECFGWCLVLGEERWRQELADGKHRARLVDRAQETSGDAVQALFEAFTDACGRAARHARATGWRVSAGTANMALGLDGVLLVVSAGSEPALKSAMLPGLGNAESTRRARSAGGKPGQPGRESRERFSDPTPRSGKRWSGRHREHERRLANKRWDGWTHDQRLYYRVFRVAVKHLRAARKLDDPRRQRGSGVYGELTTVLPRMSQLKLEHWCALREQFAAGGETR